MPGEFGPWPTVYGRFRVWRDAGVFTALLEGLIAEAAPPGADGLVPGRASPTVPTEASTPDVATWSGTVYVAFVVDVFSRAVK